MSETDPHDRAERNFTRSASTVLKKHQSQDGGDVIILAAPSVLGEFRKCCPAELKSAILAQIDEDVVNHTPDQIVSIISSTEG